MCFTAFLYSESLQNQQALVQKAHQAATKGFWQQCYNYLEQVPIHEQTDEFKLLYAETKIMLNKGSTADENYIFQHASLENQLNLYLRKKQNQKVIELATNQSSLSKNEQFILGLAYLAEHDFANAEIYLGKDSVFALYYTAYSQFLQNKTNLALENFLQVTKTYPAHYLAIESYLYAAKCCITMNNINSAIQYSLQAFNRTADKQKKSEAALFVTGIYIEQKEFQKAVELLKPLTSSFDVNSVPIRFRLAEVYSQNNELTKADQVLEATIKYFSDSEYGAEAAFKRGELFYKHNDFNTASKHFAYCRTNFPFGQFYAQALYYSSLCAQKLKASSSQQNKNDESILFLETLIQEAPDSSNIFYAYKTLAQMYQENGEYQKSLNCLKYLKENFPTESEYLNFENNENQLELLISGEDKNTVELINKYEKNGKSSTQQGRKYGVELASKYLNTVSDVQDGVNILKSILSKISENSTDKTDRETAAKANYLMGLNKCVNAEYISGSEFYIKAANFYTGINENLAAESLYKAAQALYNAKNYADSRLVLQKIQNLYATSSWTQKAASMLNGGKN